MAPTLHSHNTRLNNNIYTIKHAGPPNLRYIAILYYDKVHTRPPSCMQIL